MQIAYCRAWHRDVLTAGQRKPDPAATAVLCAPVTPPGPSLGSACSGGAQNSLCWRRGPVSRVGAGSCDTIAIAGAPDLRQEAQS